MEFSEDYFLGWMGAWNTALHALRVSEDCEGMLTPCNACRFSWPEACAQLDLAVEDSRKQKRRGTPNAIVLAGMSMPEPFDTPVQMPKSHVRMLHQLRREVRERAGLPPLVPEVKDEGADQCCFSTARYP